MHTKERTSLLLLFIVFFALFHGFAFANDVEMLKQGVVKITAKNPNRVGTGVIVGIEGKTAYIATASHVIEGDPSPQVLFYQETHPHRATTKGMEGDNPKGLAALVVEGDLPSGIHPIVFNAETQFAGGEKVTIIGFPKMVPVPWAVTEGTITGLVGPDLIFTGTVEEGNSGGPLLYKGKVVGLITEIASPFNFAKPGVIAHYELKNWDVKFTIIPIENPPEKDEHVVQPKKRKILKPPTTLPNSALSPTKIGKDGAPMVFVPEGVFTMGSPSGWGNPEENPEHSVYLDAFFIDQYEVTVERYHRFKTQTKRTNPRYWGEVDPIQDLRKPVIGLNWNDAQAYCQWAGKRLPTEAEWEKAARGVDGRLYPWGDIAPDSSTANFGLGWTPSNTYEDALKEVGTYEQGKNPYGAFNMAGNAQEWVADWYDKDYYQSSSQKNPQGPSSGEGKAIRGGNWFADREYLRAASRSWSYLTEGSSVFGVRCAQDAIISEAVIPPTQPVPSREHGSNSLPSSKTGNDGASMVLVPAGKFMMGSPDGEGDMDEHPQHLVELDTFYLDKHEVTNQQFQKFVETTEYRTTAERQGSAYGYTVAHVWEDISGANWRQPEGEASVFASGRGIHPVVAVSWEDAMAYCSWAGKRLPTEAEWEFAARAGMTSAYWWGAGGPGSQKVGNLADETVKQQFSNWVIVEGYEDGYLRTAPVGLFEANPWGLHDMAGNAWEWVADWYDAEYYGKPSRHNPHGPDKGDYRVFRGGSWSDKPQDLRSANREKGATTIRRATNGFRCAANVF